MEKDIQSDTPSISNGISQTPMPEIPATNKLPQMFVPLLILFGLILMSIFVNRQDQVGVPQPPDSPTPAAAATPISEPIPKPIYAPGEFLTFVHFHQGFSIQYPASLSPELRGDSGGNFFVELPHVNKKPSILIYLQRPKQNVANLTLQNVTDLGFPHFDSEEKIFSTLEKIISKEQISMGGKRAYKVVTDYFERIIIPQGKDIFVIEIRNKDNAAGTIDKILNTFTLIPPAPASWKLLEDPKYKTFRIKHPEKYNRILSESLLQAYFINFEFPEGTIVFRFSKDSTAGLYEDRLNFAIQLEQSQKEDVLGSKFNQNAFTFVQGSDTAIRVVHPSKQDLNLYFYLGATPVRVNAPLKLEPVLNQMLVSLNEEFDK